eukprot:5010236-Pyramimonas_sp.AAC.1
MMPPFSSTPEDRSMSIPPMSGPSGPSKLHSRFDGDTASRARPTPRCKRSAGPSTARGSSPRRRGGARGQGLTGARCRSCSRSPGGATST